MKNNFIVGMPWFDFYISDNVSEYIKSSRHTLDLTVVECFDLRFIKDFEKLFLEKRFLVLEELRKRKLILNREDYYLNKLMVLFNEDILFAKKVNLLRDNILKDKKYFDIQEYIELYEGVIYLEEFFNNISNNYVKTLLNLSKNTTEMEVPNLQWVCTLEKKSEYVKFNDESVLIIDIYQIYNYTNCIMYTQITNQDALHHPVIDKQLFDLLIKKLNSEDDMHEFCRQIGITIEEFNMLTSVNANYEIVYPILLNEIASTLFLNNCYDGAFHFRVLEAHYNNSKVEITLDENDIFSNSKSRRILIDHILKAEANFMILHEVYHWSFHSMFEENLYGQILIWTFEFTEFFKDISRNWDIGGNITKLIKQLIQRLNSDFGNNKITNELLNKCLDSFSDWTEVHVNLEVIDLDEYYCDIKALIEINKNCDLNDITFNISTIIRMLIIQEANHIHTSIINCFEGKTNIINSLNITRIQYIYFALINEIFINVYEHDYPNYDNLRNGHCNDNLKPEERLNFLLFLNLFREFKGNLDLENKLKDFFYEIDGLITLTIEYYYIPLIYETFDAIKNGFLTKSIKSVYCSKEENNKYFELNLDAIKKRSYDKMIEIISEDDKLKNEYKKEHINNMDMVRLNQNICSMFFEIIKRR